MKIGKHGSVEIYIDGVKVDAIDAVIVEAPPEHEQRIFRAPNCGEFSFTTKLSRLDMYSMYYGRRITNNWLKMHGGVMVRGDKNKKRKN